MTSGRLLAWLLMHPDQAETLTPDQWRPLLEAAYRGRLQGVLAAHLRRAGVIGRLPERLRDLLEGAAVQGVAHERGLRWEVNRLRRALLGTGVAPVLLKGGAFTLAGLPWAEGRLSVDLDILVAESHLERVEAALLRHGWETTHTDPYDQRYYRQWMHELPPLSNRQRGSELDVHHNLLPRSGRVTPDASLLLDEVVPLTGEGEGFGRLQDTDMMLHGVVHLFQDGDGDDKLRELIDLAGMVRHFGGNPHFWTELLRRSGQLGLGRPLHYALNALGLLEVDVPLPVRQAVSAWAPPAPIDRLMRRLWAAVLFPDAPRERPWWREVALLILYGRSHWLRMPPGLLTLHLARKAWRRLRKKNHVRTGGTLRYFG
ncbi:MAG: nucleotidyltransferase family protein [Magnetococcales bacterium]|nr:nucleotidyltransferase family protein [Magnetococcales bacterium]